MGGREEGGKEDSGRRIASNCETRTQPRMRGIRMAAWRMVWIANSGLSAVKLEEINDGGDFRETRRPKLSALIGPTFVRFWGG